MLDQMSMPVLFVMVFVLLGVVTLGVLVGTRILAAHQPRPPGEREAHDRAPDDRP